MNPTYYSVYKKKAAFQVKFTHAKSDPSNPFNISQGYIMLEFANVFADSGKYRSYDWKNKISMKLGVRDIAMFIVDLKKPDGVKIVHDPKAGTDESGKIFKTLTVKKGQQPGTFFWTVFFANKGEVSVPVDIYEQIILMSLLRSAIPKIFAW